MWVVVLILAIVAVFYLRNRGKRKNQSFEQSSVEMKGRDEMTNIFDYSLMPVTNLEIKQYTLAGDTNIQLARNALRWIDDCLKTIQTLCPDCPAVTINAKSLRINPAKKTRDVVDYCNVIYLPNTKTNRVPKYTEELNFFAKGVNGSVWFTPEGSIGKASVVCLPYVISVKNVQGELQISTIEDRTGGFRNTLYKG